MPLNAEISFTWVGHGTWKVRSAKGKEIIIDPWVMNNPVAPEKLKKVEKCDLMLITHGHFDHVHDALEIAKAQKPKIISNFEITSWLGSKGVDASTLIGGNTGGTIEVDGIKVTLVHAEHSCGITDGDTIVYGGNAHGLVIEFENGSPFTSPATPTSSATWPSSRSWASSMWPSCRSATFTRWAPSARPRRWACWE